MSTGDSNGHSPQAKSQDSGAPHQTTPGDEALLDRVLRLDPMFRLQWEPVQNAYVLLYPEGMVKLNQSASEILLRCDGSRTVAQVITDLETSFETSGLSPDVIRFVQHATERGWLTN